MPTKSNHIHFCSSNLQLHFIMLTHEVIAWNMCILLPVTSQLDIYLYLFLFSSNGDVIKKRWVHSEVLATNLPHEFLWWVFDHLSLSIQDSHIWDLFGQCLSKNKVKWESYRKLNKRKYMITGNDEALTVTWHEWVIIPWTFWWCYI